MTIDFDKIMFNIKQGYYKYIGSGSGRKVFDLGNGYVLKIAKNKAGIAQNKAEYIISDNDHTKLFAKVIQVSSDFSLLIMQKASKISDILYVWKYFNVSNRDEFLKTQELQEIKKNYRLLLGDFCRKSSWGMIDGKPVIIDYGFTREVVEKHYSF
ncbi:MULTISPECIES: hypothetical protein [Clostridium]|uniref:Serine/threonine protein kinase n=2 Tax=Clostridium TaxID=1485 RepID=A0A1S9N1D5_CLOBE|nr:MULTISPECIES: hypothetical protein [Clostridium]MBN7576531.1 hypothetical protein [Clostridium beijerinckii]MBN7581578.1 hypothetical protein [Clostridium beijerinckii]MBN7586288.1 hypothetical protein [Clostridium beijerinckii]MBO0522335.1 hypothetical protein [Clostridium beijerinckii]MZK49767.1 hypothetical protein [Clostridium beijerinckii]